jgi:hypothetical protein
MKMKLLLFAMLLSLFSVSCQKGDEDPEEGPSEAVPLASQRTCVTVDDCITVSSTCNGCCQRTAVNKKDSIGFEERRAEVCSRPSGFICSCIPLPMVPVCENSQCGLVAVPDP